MGWPYHFVDLTDDEKHLRRLLLDRYGVIAQVSVLLPLLVLQGRLLSFWISRNISQSATVDEPSSPYLKSTQSQGKLSINSFKASLRRWQWWAGEPVSLFGDKLGTRGEVLGAAMWLVWLLVLCFVQTGDDYLHLTKRFGTVASSQLPLHYLLALKTPWSPLQAISRCSHETLNTFHQLLGRIVTLLLYSHAALYLNFYVQANLLGDKLKQAYVLCGVFGIIAFTAVGTTALSPVRKWSYRIFYVTHVSLATAILPLLYFHVSHIRVYLYETAAIYLFNVAFRALASKSLTGTLRLLPDSGLIEITIPLPSSSVSSSYKQSWQPGQHAYISLQGHPATRTFRSNPFTVASLPSADGYLKFVARVLDGNTAKLASSIGSGASKASQQLTIEGPYGVATHADDLLQYDRVLFVAGGVGATFVVPLYRQLLNDLSPSKGSYRRQKVSFVWVARTRAEVDWAVSRKEKEKESFIERLRFCLTQDGDLGAGADGDDEGKPGDMGDGIELEEQRQLLSNGGPSGAQTGATSDLPIYTGRPDLARLVEQTMAQGGSEKVAILVCGPRTLSQALRMEVTPWVIRGREVWFWEESFSF